MVIGYHAAVDPGGKGESSEDRQWAAVTAVMPLVGWRLPWLRLVFWFGRQTTVAVRRLVDMRVIYLGRWTFLPDRTQPRYLVFETNWSGQEQSYIPDLATLMQLQWRSIFGNVKDFPGPVPTTRLLEWVKAVDWGTDLLWSDYVTRATTKTITSSLELQPRFEQFVVSVRGLPPDLLAAHWRRFVTDAQALLQP